MEGYSLGDKTDVVKDLIHNYLYEENSIVNQLYFKHKHGTSIGSFREQIWRDFFINIVPKKFVVEHSVFIIDSNGEVSNEVDLAIIDEMYTPYIFRRGQLKFIPIEAVAVAVECKSGSATKDGLEKWSKSIKALKTSDQGIARMATRLVIPTKEYSTQTATRPILIYCHLGPEVSKYHEYFDFILRANEEKQKIEISLSNPDKTLSELYQSINHAISPDITLEGKKDFGDFDHPFSAFKVDNGEDVSLLSFNFMLNQALMLLNNPMLFPHMAYVGMFNKGAVKDE